MTQHDDSRIMDWLAEGEGHGRGAALEAALTAARSTKQRPAWMVSLTGGTFAEREGSGVLRQGIVVLGALLLVALAVGGLAAGGMLPLRLPPQPVASAAAVAPTAIATPSDSLDRSPSAEPSSARPTGVVAYSVVDCSAPGSRLGCTTTGWLAATDGRDARRIPGSTIGGWSADGSRLLVSSAAGLVFLDPAGGIVATVPCANRSADDKNTAADDKNMGSDGSVCPGGNEFALSPDGTRIAFISVDPNVDNSSVVGIVDVVTGRGTLLAATRTTNPPSGDVCNTSTRIRTCEGFDGSLRWSPDGRRIAFERQGMASEPGASWDSAAVFVVDADGGNLRRVTPSSVHAMAPAWSADGTRLAFIGTDMVVNGAGTSVVDMKYDIYTIGLDGSGMTRLTDDGISSLANWTQGGRLAFIRHAAPTDSENWIMDADGGNQNRLGGSLADLTAAGCTTCVYVAQEPVFTGPLPRAYWQPQP